MHLVVWGALASEELSISLQVFYFQLLGPKKLDYYRELLSVYLRFHLHWALADLPFHLFWVLVEQVLSNEIT
jgi:hypothetical protein